MFFNDFFNLVLVCQDMERYGKTRTRGFFSAVRVVYILHKVIHEYFKTFIKFKRWPFFKKIYFGQTNSVCNLSQLEHIW